jgi:hypothetical protein
MVGRCVVGLALLGLLGAGCKRTALPEELSQALREGTEFELISIEPKDNQEIDSPNRIDGNLILGRTAVTDKETRDALVSAIEESAAPTGEEVAACLFLPRHVVRLEHKGEVYDFIICFQCVGLKVKKGGQSAASFMFDRKHKDLFNKVLTDANVKLADPSK